MDRVGEQSVRSEEWLDDDLMAELTEHAFGKRLRRSRRMSGGRKANLGWLERNQVYPANNVRKSTKCLHTML